MDDIVNEIRSIDEKIKILNEQKRKLLGIRLSLVNELQISGRKEDNPMKYRDQEDLADIVGKIRKTGKISEWR